MYEHGDTIILSREEFDAAVLRINDLEKEVSRTIDKDNMILSKDAYNTLVAQVLGLNETLDRAANYDGSEGYPCPLCEYKDGEFIKSCQMHKDMDAMVEEIANLSGMLARTTSDNTVPQAFVVAFQRMSDELHEAIENGGKYRADWIEYRRRVEEMEQYKFQLSKFSTKDLTKEIVEREEALFKQISSLKDDIYDLKYKDDEDDC